MFSEQSLSLGGFGPTSGAYGVMGAAPRFSPGGAKKNARGLFVESSQYTSLGGNMELVGGDEPLDADLPFPVETGNTEELVVGSVHTR